VGLLAATDDEVIDETKSQLGFVLFNPRHRLSRNTLDRTQAIALWLASGVGTLR
jgi:hypothetical protein